MRKNRKKGLTIEYVLVLMLITAVFGALIVTVAAQGNGYSKAYGIYLERKMFLDEIGVLSERKYIDQENIDFSNYSEENNIFGYKVLDDNNGKITVKSKESVLLTVLYRQENGIWQLEQYVYGEIRAIEEARR